MKKSEKKPTEPPKPKKRVDKFVYSRIPVNGRLPTDLYCITCGEQGLSMSSGDGRDDPNYKCDKCGDVNVIIPLWSYIEDHREPRRT